MIGCGVQHSEGGLFLSQKKKFDEGVRARICTLMFSRQGLESLNSPNGFRHRTRVEYIASESEGCRMCKFVSLAICEGYDENWADDDGLVFRNFRSGRSMGTTNARLPGICGLRGSLESELDNCIITINVFAKWGTYFHSFLVDEGMISSNKTQTIL